MKLHKNGLFPTTVEMKTFSILLSVSYALVAISALTIDLGIFGGLLDGLSRLLILKHYVTLESQMNDGTITRCGGSVISDNFLITGARCLHK